MDQQADPVMPAADTPAPRRFDLAPMGSLFEEYLQRRERMAADKRFCDEFVSALKAMAPRGVNEFVFHGNVAATLVPGQINVTKLAKELPDVHDRYIQRVVETKFDKKAFERAEPDLFDQYRARRFCLPGE